MLRQLARITCALLATVVFAVESATALRAAEANKKSTPSVTGSAPAARGIAEPGARKDVKDPAATSAGEKTGEPTTAGAVERPPVPALAGAKKNVVVIPVREEVDSPLLFIVRRGLKEAIEQKADLVVLDMKTPGGAAGVTLEIMEALDKFPGRTVTYVNDEAGSAGAIIAAVTDEIYFAPNAVMGAAELIFGTGQDAPEGLKRKMNSYLAAKVRAFSDDRPMRSDVLEAMMNPEFELKIGEKVIKPKGKLLTLTAREAVQTYGNPPAPLLAKGIAAKVNEVIAQETGGAEFDVETLEITWSEHFAVFLRALSPILLGLGMLAIYIEFKTPGFGVFGITGITCLVIVFLSNYVAGLSGHEPMLVFGLGLVLVLLELFFFPGLVFVAMSGLVVMLGALIWSMADVWPNEPVRVTGDFLVLPLRDMGLGLLIAVALALLLARFIPKGWFFSRLAVTDAVGGSAQLAGAAPEVGAAVSGLVGRRGVAATGLYPSGQVEIEGRRYEARLEVGTAPPGTPVVVRRKTDFALIVEREEERA